MKAGSDSSSLDGLVFIAVVAVVATIFFSWKSDFPFYYHPDEPGKVRQVLEDERNFLHPLLMVNTGAVFHGMGGGGQDPQAAVLAGRWAAALFSGLAVALLAGVARRRFGFLPGLAAAGFLLSDGDVFQLAHYFKEDPALVFGFASVFFGLVRFVDCPGWRRVAVLGAAAGIAASAKFVGILAFPLALLGLLAAPARRLGWRKGLGLAGVLAVAFLVSVVALNFRAVLEFESFRDGLDREAGLALGGGVVEKESIPHFKYLRDIRDFARSERGVFLVLAFVAAWRQRRRWDFSVWLLFSFPFLYAFALGFSAKISPRYFLPSVYVLNVLCAIGVVEAFSLLSAFAKKRGWVPGRAQQMRWALAGLVGLGVVVGGGLRIGSVVREIGATGRADLAAFIREQLPRDAVILQGIGVHLPDRSYPLYAGVVGGTDESVPQSLITEKYPQEFASFDALPAKGVTHVAIAEYNFKRYLRKGAKPKPGREEEFFLGKSFFTDLFARGHLLWETGDEGSKTHRPHLRLYALSP